MSTKKSIFIGEQEINIKAVAFDKDGTLFDAREFWFYINNLRKKQLVKIIDKKFEKSWDEFMGVSNFNKIDYEGVLATASIEEELVLAAGLIYQNSNFSWSKCKEISLNIFNSSDREIIIKEAFSIKQGAKEILYKLNDKGFYTGILTSDCLARTEDCMKFMQVIDFLDFIVTPEIVKQGKPSPDMINKVCDDLVISPCEIAVIGDSTLDMKMAKSAGSIAIGLVTYNGSKEILSREADFLIESFNDIKL